MGELVGVATGHPLLALALLLITAVRGVLRDWFSYRREVHGQAQPTRRLELVVDGTSSTDRAAALRALAEVEAASHSVERAVTERRTWSSRLPREWSSRNSRRLGILVPEENR